MPKKLDSRIFKKWIGLSDLKACVSDLTNLSSVYYDFVHIQSLECFSSIILHVFVLNCERTAEIKCIRINLSVKQSYNNDEKKPVWILKVFPEIHYFFIYERIKP